MIVKEGYPFVAFTLLLSLLLVWTIGAWGFVSFVLPFYMAVFFRNPRRVPPRDPSLLLSPADGKIIGVGEVQEGRFLKGMVQKVSIFMSPLDVHLNRIPFSGRIRQISYQSGSFHAAFKGKSSGENEQNAILLETPHGGEILFIQIAGWLARRIVCHLHEGDEVLRGAPFGMIRFGSRMDVYFPRSLELLVRTGERAKAGVTPLARFS